jgi:pterin-4a-carbinolamine dehydratase
MRADGRRGGRSDRDRHADRGEGGGSAEKRFQLEPEQVRRLAAPTQFLNERAISDHIDIQLHKGIQVLLGFVDLSAAVDSIMNEQIGNLIFLSYRRADTGPQTLALKLELERRLRAVQVFMDNGAIAGADKFPDEINSALGAASLIIAVIGKAWFGVQDSLRRIDDPEDWVFKEINFALHNKPGALLPILVDGAGILSANDLPNELRDLSTIQALKLIVADWDSNINQLIRLLKDRFKFMPKQEGYIYPRPDTLKSKTPPYPWEILETYVKLSLAEWIFEFEDDPDGLYYKWFNLRRDFEFASYKKAIEFVNLIAQHSVDEQHHVQFLVTWKTVSVWTSTWDAGHRITPYDIAFAKYLERKYKSDFGSK